MAINDLLNGMILQVAASPTYKLADLSPPRMVQAAG